MEAVLLIGLQASGKSTFYRQRFGDTHIRINLDMLKTRVREATFVETCLRTLQPFVVDNTNPTVEDRVRYIAPAKTAGFRVVGYYFQSRLSDCLARNARRTGNALVPDAGLLGTAGRLALPSLVEGFDELFYVSIGLTGEFLVETWNDEL